MCIRDRLKRTRGRRGLDILKRIQTEFDMLVKIDHHDYDDVTGVDSKLIRLGPVSYTHLS